MRWALGREARWLKLCATCQGCWCPGLAAERSKAGGVPRRVQLVHCSTQPAAALRELLSSFPLTDAPGASSSLIPFCHPVPRWSHSNDCTLWERGDGWTLATNQFPGWALSQWGSWPQSPSVPSLLCPGLQCGGALFCSSEIPSDLQDTQPSPEAIDLRPACHILSPPISVLSSQHAGGRRMHILHSLGNYSPASLCSIPRTPSHSPIQPHFQASPRHPAWLELL